MRALRLALYLVVGLLLGAASVLSYAGTFSSYQGSAYRNINGSTYFKGDKGTLSQSQASVLESVNIGGTYMTIPTLGQITSGASALALVGIRASPVIGTASTLAWLAQQGLQHFSDGWKKPPEDFPSTGPGSAFDSNCGGSATQCAVTSASASYQQYGATWISSTSSTCTWQLNGYPHVTGSCSKTMPCPAGSELIGGVCRGSEYVPAGESDWDRVNGVTPPDDVMKDLCQSLAKYNTTSPGCQVFNARTTGTSQPLSDWSPVPGGNAATRQVATWKPSPTADDPFRGELSINEETKTTTSTTDPVTGETTTSETTTSTDKTDTSPLCQLYPDILACAKFGEAEAPASIDKEKQVSINPDSGFGASDGQCPSDLTYTVRTGHTLRFSYQPVCTGLRTFRPVIIGMAWISAVLIFLGIARKAQG